MGTPESLVEHHEGDAHGSEDSEGREVSALYRRGAFWREEVPSRDPSRDERGADSAGAPPKPGADEHCRVEEEPDGRREDRPEYRLQGKRNERRHRCGEDLPRHAEVLSTSRRNRMLARTHAGDRVLVNPCVMGHSLWRKQPAFQSGSTSCSAPIRTSTSARPRHLCLRPRRAAGGGSRGGAGRSRDRERGRAAATGRPSSPLPIEMAPAAGHVGPPHGRCPLRHQEMTTRPLAPGAQSVVPPLPALLLSGSALFPGTE